MKPHLSDEQIHRAVLAFQGQHHVSYAEALTHVTTISSTRISGFSEPSHAPADDVKVDAAAKVYAAENLVSYSEALRQVTRTSQGRAAGLSEPVTTVRQPSSDAEIDTSARAYSSRHGVSYSEALSIVVASFSEAIPAKNASDLLSGQPIEIFHSGDLIDDAGAARKFTPADIQATAAGYDPAKHEAPLTLGHTTTDSPAYGWVKSLQATPDGRLLMLAGQIDPAFADMVKSGRYKKRSAQFYPPLHPGNPVPGTWYLKHVAWLGAVPPAVKGMPDARFSEGAEMGLVTFAA